MASTGSAAAAAQNYMKLSVAQKITRNNTLDKVHVAATKLPQLSAVIIVHLQQVYGLIFEPGCVA